MVSISVGLVFVCAGAAGILRWFPEFVAVLKGMLPLTIFFGGVIALVMGFASFRRNKPNVTKAK